MAVARYFLSLVHLDMQAASQATGLVVVAVHTTAANMHDGQCMASCPDQVALSAGSRILADNGYLFSK